MCCRTVWLILLCCSLAGAIRCQAQKSPSAPARVVPLPFNSALEFAASVQGQFVNLETNERKTLTVQPQVLWVVAEELSITTEELRRALRSEWRGAQLFQSPLWQQWQHRTFQSIKAPDGWFLWDIIPQPGMVRLFLRDKEKRLTEARLVTWREEFTVKAKDGVVQTQLRLKPTDSAALILRDREGTRAILLLRWTPLAYAERVGIVADAGVVPVKVGRCAECQQGETIAREIFIEWAPPPAGFVRVYRRLAEGDLLPTLLELPHFPAKPVADLIVRDVSSSKAVSEALVEFVRSIPPLSLQEAVRILWHEVRSGTPYRPPQWKPRQRGTAPVPYWEFYDGQRRRYVAVAWEVWVRIGALPPKFSSYNEAAYRTRDIAQEIVRTLPLNPPNDVAAMVVKRLRERVRAWRIGLRPRATIWFEGIVVKQRGTFYEPPPPSQTYQRQQWELRQQFVQQLRDGRIPLVCAWRIPEGLERYANISVDGRELGGTVRLRWLRWLKPDKRTLPPQQEWLVGIGQMVSVFPDAEYVVTPQPPDGFQTVKAFRLALLIAQSALVAPADLYQVPLRVTTTDPQASGAAVERSVGTYPHLTLRKVVELAIRLTQACLWELRVTFDRVPVKGEVTITLEGNGRRWKQKAIAKLTGAWDIPVHPRWLFPDPRRPSEFVASGAAVFRRIPPGRYTLRVEGEIGGEASVNISMFRDRPKIVTRSEPIRQVRWQKDLEVGVGIVETVTVPLP